MGSLQLKSITKSFGATKVLHGIDLKVADGEILFGAFTGKAALVMRSKGCKDARTIHSLIYRATDTETETPTFMLNEESPAASAGLIITEATQVCDTAQGYPNTPGIHTDAQTLAWRAVADAVHDAGGRIVTQLWHVGRISHPRFQPNGAAPVAPSAIAAKGQLYTGAGMEPFPVPRALETAEIPALVRHFADAAKRAVFDAGLDGVEIHAANGYLIDQFLRDGTNTRTDQYGGTVENRCRFLLEILEATAHAVGADRIGVRLSPTGAFNDMTDSDPLPHFLAITKALNPFNLAYLHVIEGRPGHHMAPPEGAPHVASALRAALQAFAAWTSALTSAATARAVREASPPAALRASRLAALRLETHVPKALRWLAFVP